MNRLILLGNGFALAHRLQTGYNDFIKSYLKKCLATSQVGRPYEDAMILVEKVEYFLAKLQGMPLFFTIGKEVIFDLLSADLERSLQLMERRRNYGLLPEYSHSEGRSL